MNYSIRIFYRFNAYIIILLLSSIISCKSCSNLIKQQYVAFNNDPYANDIQGEISAKNILLVADNQINNLYTNPDVLRSKLMDKKVRVAVRPPQVDLFSRDMLQWILKNYGKDKYIIHLGDALNIACQSEWDQFVETMNAKSSTLHKGWVMIPGNHDSCYYGNLQPNKADRPLWEKACSTSASMFAKGVISDKNIFIRNYLLSLVNQYNNFPSDFTLRREEYDSYELNTIAQWESPRKNSFLKKIAFRYSNGKQQKSFIVQLLNLSLDDQNNVFAILLDTTDYSEWKVEPDMTGAIASIGKEQLEIVNKWISDLKKENDNIKYFLIGHSPISELYYNYNAQKWLSDRAEAKDGLLCYISAHTHSGWIKNSKSIIDDIEFYEMNVGSATDWSDTEGYDAITARTLDLINGKVFSKRILIRSASNINNNDHFDYSSGKNCYSCYKNDNSGIYTYTIDTLLLTYVRLFKDLNVNTRVDVKILIDKANELLDQKCIDKPIPEDFTESFFIGKIKDCFEQKLFHIQEMERKDEQLMQNNNYKNARLLYGACQTVRASKAEFQ